MRHRSANSRRFVPVLAAVFSWSCTGDGSDPSDKVQGDGDSSGRLDSGHVDDSAGGESGRDSEVVETDSAEDSMPGETGVETETGGESGIIDPECPVIYDTVLFTGADAGSEMEAFCGAQGGVSGDLIVEATTTVSDLEPLSCVCSIGSTLWISLNDSLTSLHGLEELTSVAEIMFIAPGPLSDISALAGLKGDAVDELLIEAAFDLRVLTGLEGLVELERLELYYTSVVSVDGLVSLEIVSGNVDFGRNDELLSLEGLSSLHTVDASFEVSDSAGVGVVPNLSYVGETLAIHDFEDATNIGEFPLLTYAGWFGVARNPNVSDLNGLYALEDIVNSLTIHEMDGLTSLTGLESLRTIGGDIWIEECPSLEDITALYGLEHVGGCIDIVCPGITEEEVDDLRAVIGDVGTVCLDH